MKKINISIIGLGYVGLPLALEFGKKYNVVGYDLNKERIKQLKNNIDINNDISCNEIRSSNKILFSNNEINISNSNYYIITVPTPIKKNKQPDKSKIFNACKLVGKFLKKNDIVIFESTVYPGLTEEECAPILENISKLKYNKEFFCGYSPERINPGDKIKKLKNIIKITSGSNFQTLNKVDNLYKTIINAGTHKVKSIKIAEAAKVIENAQRDLNIGFVNELSLIFDKMELDTNEILKAANTKWNFLNFKPGLVGGHCIGVDPYYLTYKSQKIGLNPKLILSARSVNDNMPKYIIAKLIKNLKKKRININGSKILILGLTFKENCSDIRNSKVFDIIDIAVKKNAKIDVYDPYVNIESLNLKRKFNFISKPKKNFYDCVLILVGHEYFIKSLGSKKIINYGKKNNVIFDIKNIFPHKNEFIKL